MASNGGQPPASAPMVSVEEPTASASAPISNVVSAAPVSAPIVSEPVISQVQSVAPLVSGFDPNLHGQLTNEQIRQAQGEAARRGYEEGSRPNQRVLPLTSTYANYASMNSNPFETGTAFSEAPRVNMGLYPTSSSSGTSSEPNAQRIFPIQHGVSPSTHDANLVAQQTNAVSNGGTPFTLGNRAPRNATSNTGGMRRRLDSTGLRNIRYEPQAGVVASNQKIRAVGVALIGMGIPEHQLTEVGVYLARHCADVGASDKSTLLGTFPGSDITLEEVGTMIKQTEGCTLRQYCAFYAKHVWNLMLQTQSPPANWVGKEFKFETRYAAFDFFFGVESTASLEPADGLIRLPTQAERVANATSKEIQMYRIRSMEGTQAVNFGEVTGGKIGPKPVLSIRK
uniref:Capsid protein n=1 Tax=Foveavirus mali TaxID=35350 RepID=A0A7G7XYM3_9VIRU|nr:coat protein [Apple stem pitting virus]QNH86252.1 coat protein [Apple stem pitting virus]QNH86253.1 coat protein [Apple stem pitting virus]